MSLLNKILVSLGYISLILSGCSKDEPTISNTPKIELLDVTPLVIQEFSDEVVFTLSYLDGDGDLGENHPDAKNLWITDNRMGLTYAYRVPQLAPEGKVAIKGTLIVSLKNVVITDGSSQQNVMYNIYLKDRAGNISNTVTSPLLTIKK
jgi:hypothetical protein